MNRFFLLIIVMFTITFCSCEKSEVVQTPVTQNPSIIGTWVEAGYRDSVTIYRRATQFDDTLCGFTFYANRKIIERKNIGWCGTPPVELGNFDGIWSTYSEDILDIDVAYWGGKEQYRLKIISVQNDTLIVFRIRLPIQP